jgi:hypothetical protein
MEGTKRTAGRQNSPTKADHDIRLGRQVESHPNPTARPIAAALSNEVIEIEVMKKPRELYETELAAIRGELLRLGARPRESLTELAISVRSEEQVTPPAMMMAAYDWRDMPWRRARSVEAYRTKSRLKGTANMILVGVRSLSSVPFGPLAIWLRSEFETTAASVSKD